MKYFNCHAHVFNMQYVPDNFLSFQLNARVASAGHWVLNKRWLAKGLMFLIKPFLKANGKKTIAFLKIGLLKSQDLVFQEMLNQYPKSDDVRFIILPLNFKYMGAGNLDIPYEQQLLDLFEVKKRYPEKCFPFVAIDPRMGSSDENAAFVARYIEKGFSGIKLYPAMGFYPFDYRLDKTYAMAAENRTPILTHCSKGGINYCSTKEMDSMVSPTDINGTTYAFPYDPKMKLGEYCDPLNSPYQWEVILKKYPALKVCIAHLGMDSSTNFNNFSDPNKPDFDWYKKLRALMDTYENVYADISYSLAYDPFYPWFLKEYANMKDSVKKRIMFGTDYFMTVQEVNGDENQLITNAAQKLGPALFKTLACDNVVNYLNSKTATY
jgi:predicted TIM-barrel fold metal-dependent hydrolase